MDYFLIHRTYGGFCNSIYLTRTTPMYRSRMQNPNIASAFKKSNDTLPARVLDIDLHNKYATQFDISRSPRNSHNCIQMHLPSLIVCILHTMHDNTSILQSVMHQASFVLHRRQVKSVSDGENRKLKMLSQCRHNKTL